MKQDDDDLEKVGRLERQYWNKDPLLAVELITCDLLLIKWLSCNIVNL